MRLAEVSTTSEYAVDSEGSRIRFSFLETVQVTPVIAPQKGVVQTARLLNKIYYII